MKLTDLNPQWVGAGGAGITDGNGNPVPERRGLGITFDCPCGCDRGVFIPFANPLDGGAPWDPDEPRRARWQRTGDTFDALTLTPSIQRLDGCRWHGWLQDGRLVPC